ncbi:hypothetical protein G9F73_016655 [Clostridium estertheticum]|uniref:hypothetical protein n=1 Tax=Clostridium estertheticum TaxID=238834 RepID=UPI0013EEAA37|nr:hypothetical protein [Clostridium estertheticum]MBZ9609418.1 hypothetical protein [Clostridium estertheticum]
MPVEFLTSEQEVKYGKFTERPTLDVVRQNIALWNCIPKSNYNYNTNNYLVINCFFNKHIISITKAPNDLTS